MQIRPRGASGVPELSPRPLAAFIIAVLMITLLALGYDAPTAVCVASMAAWAVAEAADRLNPGPAV